MGVQVLSSPPICLARLTVRTSGFHPEDRSSTLRRGASMMMLWDGSHISSRACSKQDISSIYRYVIPSEFLYTLTSLYRLIDRERFRSQDLSKRKREHLKFQEWDRSRPAILKTTGTMVWNRPGASKPVVRNAGESLIRKHAVTI